MLFWHGIPRGIDFKGGTEVTVQFATTPNEDHIRQALSSAGVKDVSVHAISDTTGRSANLEVISLPQTASETAHDVGRQQIEDAIKANYPDRSEEHTSELQS